jgi:3-hydroxyanthranilate 3,4-dioxygenase
MMDGFEWYCFGCEARIHRIEVPLNNIVDDLPPLYDAVYDDDEARTCSNCGVVHPGRGDPPADWVTL